jgi:hypothetical protein
LRKERRGTREFSSLSPHNFEANSQFLGALFDPFLRTGSSKKMSKGRSSLRLKIGEVPKYPFVSQERETETERQRERESGGRVCSKDIFSLIL